jgi:hypothetical protein
MHNLAKILGLRLPLPTSKQPYLSPFPTILSSVKSILQFLRHIALGGMILVDRLADSTHL